MSITTKSEFESLFKEHYATLVAYARRMVDGDLAEDIVQQMFVSLWEKRNAVDINTNTSSYLLRSVHNACLNRLKHEKVQREHAEHVIHTSTESDANDLLEAEEFKLKVKRAVQSLPTECKKVFLMSRIQEKKYQEIADELSISVKTVENQMGKALRVLRNELKEEIRQTMRIVKTIFWLGIGVRLASVVISRA